MLCLNHLGCYSNLKNRPAYICVNEYGLTESDSFITDNFNVFGGATPALLLCVMCNESSTIVEMTSNSTS